MALFCDIKDGEEFVTDSARGLIALFVKCGGDALELGEFYGDAVQLDMFCPYGSFPLPAEYEVVPWLETVRY